MSMLGIDVSEHNGALDWAMIKAAGVAFTIVRSGYGTSHVDNFFAQNIRERENRGSPWASIIFLTPWTPPEPKKRQNSFYPF